MTLKNDTQHNKTRANMHYYTGCRNLFVILLSVTMLNVDMLIVIILIVIMLIVMAPFKEDKNVIKTSNGSMLAFRH